MAAPRDGQWCPRPAQTGSNLIPSPYARIEAKSGSGDAPAAKLVSGLLSGAVSVVSPHTARPRCLKRAERGRMEVGYGPAALKVVRSAFGADGGVDARAPPNTGWCCAANIPRRPAQMVSIVDRLHGRAIPEASRPASAEIGSRLALEANPPLLRGLRLVGQLVRRLFLVCSGPQVNVQIRHWDHGLIRRLG